MIVLRLVRRPDGAPAGPAVRPIEEGGSTIGRAPDCDLVLDDPLRLVSRRHAWIVPQGPAEALLRCISTTATLLVNGEALPPGGERVVQVGDRLRIGGFEVQPRTAAASPADARSVQGLLDHWADVLVAIGYLDPAAPKKLMPRLNQALNRAQVTTEEVHILRGIARAITASRESD